MPAASAMVRWSKREDVKTEYTENLKLVDRVFLLGDIVARANDQLGQTGIITGMRMYCDCTLPVGFGIVTESGEAWMGLETGFKLGKALSVGNRRQGHSGKRCDQQHS